MEPATDTRWERRGRTHGDRSYHMSSFLSAYGLESLVLDGTLITTRDTTRFTPAHYVRESRKEGRMTDRREARPAWSIR